MSAPEARLPLSYAQEFLCAFDKGDEGGPFGPRYHNARGMRLTGPVDVEALGLALNDLVERHETLRTLIVRDDGEPYQKIMPPVPAELVTYDLAGVAPADRDKRAEEFVNEIEAGTLSVRQLPVMRAHLGRFDDLDGILVLIAHHVATDGWSMRILVRDLAVLYARRTGETAELPVVPQYRQFTQYQRGSAPVERMNRSVPYWREKLDGARMLAIEMDRPRSVEATKVTSTYRFVVDPELSAAVVRFAAVNRSSTFMILMAAYGILLYRLTGVSDVVVPTITAGRNDPGYDDTVGPFFNFVPLRTDLSSCQTLQDVVSRTRTTCIEAQNHDIPFGFIAPEAPELMSPFAADNLAVGAMQVFQNPVGGSGQLNSRVSYVQLRNRLMFQPVSANIPDGILWTLEVDPADGISGAVKFNRNEFDTATVAKLVEDLLETLRTVVTSPNSPLEKVAPPVAAG